MSPPKSKPSKVDKVRPATIRSVAKAAGVSIATISRALHEPERLRPATRAKVEAVVRGLGYTPNVQARNLRTSQTKLIIAITPDIANPFCAEVVRGIEKVAHQNGYSVLLGDTEFDTSREEKYADLVRARQADGLITTLPRIPRLVANGRNPIVHVGGDLGAAPDITSVSVDSVAGATAATDYLVALGHRKIAFVRGPDGSVICEEREAGFRQALKKAGVDVDPRLIVGGDFSPDAGIRAVETLTARNVKFTAVFCSNDEMAFGAISAIRASGRRVPNDVSVVGFDDIRFARYFDPPLTTVAQPMKEIGMEAARLLLDILSGKNPPTLKRVFPTQLIVRATTAPNAD